MSSIAVDPHDAYHAIVTFSNYEVKSIFSTTDGGDTWTDVSGNLEEHPTGRGSGPSVNWVAMLPQNGSNIYFAGSSAGLYSTSQLNGFRTIWLQQGANTIGNVDVRMVVTREADGEVAVATYGNGVYSRDFEISVAHENSKVPTRFQLQKNYPNPFNTETTISFTLPQSAAVSLEVFNARGQFVKTLIHRDMDAGYHRIVWNGKDVNDHDVASGTYIYTLRARDEVFTKRMTLIR